MQANGTRRRAREPLEAGCIDSKAIPFRYRYPEIALAGMDPG